MPRSRNPYVRKSDVTKSELRVERITNLLIDIEQTADPMRRAFLFMRAGVFYFLTNDRSTAEYYIDQAIKLNREISPSRDTELDENQYTSFCDMVRIKKHKSLLDNLRIISINRKLKYNIYNKNTKFKYPAN